ncbi:MAG: acetyl-CoA carboxylase biotin carboxylase subunit [Gammaproteobacteria bacterium]
MGFKTILVANRGEIACRVMRTATRLGYGTVAVYSEADAQAPHVMQADRAVCIGPAPTGESYLRIDRIIEACKASGADAVHPGYGFLSENAAFAAACAEAGITFIGPPVNAIDLMGNKSRARRLMIDAGVPCVPGYDGDEQKDAHLAQEAARIGYPVMVKAAAGGGGRGMRLVHRAEELVEALQSARAEAAKSFGSDQLLLEKAVLRPRHVEFQVFADRHGNVIHLGERDCSAQRRHQKVIEEAPCPVMTPALRAAMGRAAVHAARAVDYVGAGTVEFLLAENGEFYFLEMNTRLQVEHPVTELITGQDLVAWQLAVADGEPLPMQQEDVSLRGHAIEVRLYAEDRRFVPQTGRILRWRPASGSDVRIDAGIVEGGLVTPHYDPMLAKMIAWGETREEARRKLVAALRRSVVLGLSTNKTFLADLCDHPVFAAGATTTAFIGEHFADLDEVTPEPAEWVLAALAFVSNGNPRASFPPGWRNGSRIPATLRLSCGAARVQATLSLDVDRRAPGTACYRVSLARPGQPAETIHAELAACGDGNLVAVIEGVRRECLLARADDALWLDAGRETLCIRNVTDAPAASGPQAGSGVLVAPMDGVIVRVLVNVGDRVARGQVLMLIEAMKMEHRIVADVDGEVAGVCGSAGTQVRNRQKLVEIRAGEPLTPTPLPEGERGSPPTRGERTRTPSPQGERGRG